MKPLVQICLAFLGLFLPLLMSAQENAKIELGASHKTEYGEHRYFLNNADNSKMLKVYVQGKFVTLQLLDHKTLEEVNKVKHKDFPPKFVFECVIQLKEKVYFFYSLWDKKNRIEQLFAREIDFETCSFVGEPKRIIALDRKLAGNFSLGGWSSWKSFWAFGVVNKFAFTVSVDQASLLIVCKDKPKGEKKGGVVSVATGLTKAQENDPTFLTKQDTMHTYLLDEQLNTIATNDIVMPYPRIKMAIDNCLVGSDNKVYYIASINNNKDIKNKEPNYRFELLSIDIKTQEVLTHKLDYDKRKVLSQIILQEYNADELVLTGTYNDDYDRNEAVGTFAIKYNKNTQESRSNYYGIPLDVVQIYHKAKLGSRDKGIVGVRDLQAKETILLDDGSLLLFSQRFYKTSYHAGNGVYRTTYHYDDIIATKVAPDGELLWMKKICRYQTGDTFKYLSKNNKHYLIFDTQPPSVCLSKEEIKASEIKKEQYYLFMYTLDDDTGKSDLNLLLGFKENKIYGFHNTSVVQQPNQSFIFTSSIKGDKNKLVRVTLK